MMYLIKTDPYLQYTICYCLCNLSSDQQTIIVSSTSQNSQLTCIRFDFLFHFIASFSLCSSQKLSYNWSCVVEYCKVDMTWRMVLIDNTVGIFKRVHMIYNDFCWQIKSEPTSFRKTTATFKITQNYKRNPSISGRKHHTIKSGLSSQNQNLYDFMVSFFLWHNFPSSNPLETNFPISSKTSISTETSRKLLDVCCIKSMDSSCSSKHLQVSCSNF